MCVAFKRHSLVTFWASKKVTASGGAPRGLPPEATTPTESAYGHHWLRNSRSLRNTLASGAPAGRESSRAAAAMTHGLSRRKKVLISRSSPSVVTMGAGRILPARRSSSALRALVVRFAVEREAQVVREVVVARIDACRRAASRAGRRRCVQCVRMAAVVAVAGARVEQRVAAEQRRLVVCGRRQMWHIVWPGVSRHSSSTVVPTWITSPAPTPRPMPGMRARHSRCATSLRRSRATIASLPPMWSPCSCVFRIWVMCQPLALARREALLVVERIDRQRLAGFAAGDQVVEVAPALAVQICSTSMSRSLQTTRMSV